MNRAKLDPKRLVLSEGAHEKVLRAAQVILDEGFARVVLLGERAQIEARIVELDLHLDGVEIVDPRTSPRTRAYAEEYLRLRERKGATLAGALAAAADPSVFGAMMVHFGEADALVAGVGQSYPETIRPALQVVGMRPGVSRVASLFMMVVDERLIFFADPTVNIEPTAEELADIAICTADEARRFGVEPRVAMLSFSNFGSVSHPLVAKVQRATRLATERRPDLVIEGEMQADTAVNPDLIREHFPFSRLRERANVLIFPDLQSANISYKLLQRLGGAEAVGPILMGMRKPVHVLQRGCEVKEIVHMAAIAVIDAQGETTAQRPVEHHTVAEPEMAPV
jgi:malate dehydrogenase (oxaloacetate-decarboxylating)(NADP+)